MEESILNIIKFISFINILDYDLKKCLNFIPFVLTFIDIHIHIHSEEQVVPLC